MNFEARLPDDPPSWVIDAEKSIAAGFMVGLSPGFVVPPASAVPDAERLEPEPGNPGWQIRVIRAAVLREFSVVTAPVYADAAVDLRGEDLWPGADAEAAPVAVTITAAEVAAAVGVDSTTATRLLAVVTELVNRFAPDAPDAIANEGAIRTAGWLAEQPSAAIRSETEGDIRTSYAPMMQSALRHSGAMALLSPWKVRRAGAI